MTPEPISRDEEICAAALAWWLSHRPLAYTESMHRLHPTINCVTPQAHRLAASVASWVVEREQP